jgi:outer membrane immunogenic protein
MLGRCAIVAMILTGSAASIVEAAPRSPLAYRWTGWYIGGNGGYAWGSGDVGLSPTATGSGLFPAEEPFILASQVATLGPLDTHPSGGLGGLQTGYNLQFGAIVLGVETDYDWGNISDSNSRTLHSEFNIPGEPGFGVTTNVTARERLESLGTLRARLGFTPLPTLLLFGTGGLAFGRASSDIGASQIETAVPPAVLCNNFNGGKGITFTNSSGGRSNFLTGWTAGGGGEWAFAPNLSAKVEYLHYDLGTMHYSANSITDISCGGAPFASVSLAPSANFSGDLVRAGLNFKIGP